MGHFFWNTLYIFLKSIVAITYFRALVPTYTLAFRSPYTLRIIYAFIYLKSIAAFIQPNPRSIYASIHPWHILPHHSDQMSESLFNLWRVISRFKEVITYKYPGSWRLYQVITNKITQFAKAILSLTTRVVGVHVWLWLSVYGSCNEMRWWGLPRGDLGAGRIHFLINATATKAIKLNRNLNRNSYLIFVTCGTCEEFFKWEEFTPFCREAICVKNFTPFCREAIFVANLRTFESKIFRPKNMSV